MLDTNVLMHDPTAIFRFEEHDIYLPMVVLEELDANKKGLSEASRNVRQVSRFLDELMRDATKEQIDRGLELPAAKFDERRRQEASRRAAACSSRPRRWSAALPDTLPGHGADNAILGQTLALQDEFRDARVTLVSKDINLRIKAAVLGVHAEDYYSDKTIEDADVLYTGVQALPANFWERHGKNMNSWKEHSRTFYQVHGPDGARVARQPVRVPEGRRTGIEAHGPQHRRQRRSAGAGARLPQRAAQRLGHHRAQPRAELRAQPADGSGDRLRHHPRPGRHRQDAADARRGSHADAGDATASARSS